MSVYHALPLPAINDDDLFCHTFIFLIILASFASVAVLDQLKQLFVAQKTIIVPVKSIKGLIDGINFDLILEDGDLVIEGYLLLLALNAVGGVILVVVFSRGADSHCVPNKFISGVYPVVLRRICQPFVVVVPLTNKRQ